MRTQTNMLMALVIFLGCSAPADKPETKSQPETQRAQTSDQVNEEKIQLEFILNLAASIDSATSMIKSNTGDEDIDAMQMKPLCRCADKHSTGQAHFHAMQKDATQNKKEKPLKGWLQVDSDDKKRCFIPFINTTGEELERCQHVGEKHLTNAFKKLCVNGVIVAYHLKPKDNPHNTDGCH
jgi:hypothetical protein